MSINGTAQVFQALDRLDKQGLGSADAPRGLTTEGIQTLSDLLAVAIFQFGSKGTQPSQVASATARAMASALGDVLSEMQDEPTRGADTLKLLASATREARGG